MIGVGIQEWSAWAPGLSTREAWGEFFKGTRDLSSEGSPEVSTVPPLLRRRMSRLTRMSAAVAMECCRRAAIPAADVRVVFASRHGEMGVTVDLLKQMQEKQPLSPMDFSGSVHHTALAYFSMATGNRQAQRAVGAGEASFHYGFLEAVGMLSENDRSPVLLIAAEDLVPPPFGRLTGKNAVPFAMAFLLARARPGRMRNVSLEICGRDSSGKNSDLSRSSALDFLQWFLSGSKQRKTVLSQRVWRWEK